MHKYEAMFILRPDMNEGEKINIFSQIKETFNKFNAKVNNADTWLEKRKLYFQLSIKAKGAKFNEGLYYLADFQALPLDIGKINAAFKLNEEILRFLITVKE